MVKPFPSDRPHATGRRTGETHGTTDHPQAGARRRGRSRCSIARRPQRLADGARASGGDSRGGCRLRGRHSDHDRGPLLDRRAAAPRRHPGQHGVSGERGRNRAAGCAADVEDQRPRCEQRRSRQRRSRRHLARECERALLGRGVAADGPRLDEREHEGPELPPRLPGHRPGRRRRHGSGGRPGELPDDLAGLVHGSRDPHPRSRSHLRLERCGGHELHHADLLLRRGQHHRPGGRGPVQHPVSDPGFDDRRERQRAHERGRCDEHRGGGWQRLGRVRVDVHDQARQVRIWRDEQHRSALPVRPPTRRSPRRCTRRALPMRPTAPGRSSRPSQRRGVDCAGEATSGREGPRARDGTARRRLSTRSVSRFRDRGGRRSDRPAHAGRFRRQHAHPDKSVHVPAA